jgi:DNA modification methylase
MTEPTFTIHNGNCIEVMRTMADNSVDSIVTDPPYELGFMGKSWDSTGIAFNVEVWTEALRVLKPGGHLLAFSGSRTYHRMAVAIEDAGFQIRDQIMWLYGSGFPKSLDVSKAIDKRRDDWSDIASVVYWLEQARKQSGVTRKEVEKHFGTINIGQGFFTVTDGSKPRTPTWEQWLELKQLLKFGNEMDDEVWRLNGRKGQPGEAYVNREVVGVQSNAMAGWNMDGTTKFADRDITAPSTPEAQQWAGWGTALKPAHEPIVLARKPLIGTVAANVLEYGTGGLNIDGSRVGSEVLPEALSSPTALMGGLANVDDRARSKTPERIGRFPANIIHDGSDEVGELLGEPARFFYCAKASKRDRNEGLDGFEAIRVHDGRQAGNKGGSNPRNRTNDVKVNHHPTVKPTDLMRYLVKLITPPNGIVLDPFTGSGSTGKGAVMEGFNFIGIELDPDYVAIATARIQHQLDNIEPTLFTEETS